HGIAGKGGERPRSPSKSVGGYEPHTRPPLRSYPSLPQGERGSKKEIMDQADIDAVRRRTLWGVASMTARELVIKLLALAGWIVLARLLDPPVFGLFAIANFSVNVFVLFSEVGLGAALVRRAGPAADDGPGPS